MLIAVHWKGEVYLFKYSFIVLLGACSYGVLSTFVKLAYGRGFTPTEVISSQFLVGWLCMAMLYVFTHKQKIQGKTFIKLALVGTTICLTGTFYYLSLQTLPASIAIILLFQFTWIGIILESIYSKKKPQVKIIIALILLFSGTLLAAGTIDVTATFSFSGVLLGLLAALSFALFIFFSGKVATNIPSIQRSFYMTCGALLLALFLFPPTYFIHGTSAQGLAFYSVSLGIFGIVLPTLLFAIGMPKIGSSLGTILGAAELPTAVIMSVVVLHETVTFVQWLGVALILIGIAYSQKKDQSLALQQQTHSPHHS